jgi:hypothetical protein
VLGGFGTSQSPTGQTIGSFYNNAGWYDDVADGPVTATIKIHSTGDTYTAVGAWVIVAPPKFAPGIDNVITLYDRLFDLAVQQGWLSAPSTPSYTQDIYPILQRARDTTWVRNVGSFAHTSWADPVTDAGLRNAIFGRLKNPGGGGSNMPRLLGSDGHLTATQYQMMEKWKDGSFSNDWSGVPLPPVSITPGGLDEAALENCVGAAFFPGIEAGGLSPNQPVLVPGNYQAPFRFGHGTVSPGDISQYMALPWQADFKACGTEWWPVPRPNNVIPQGTGSYQDWDRGVGSMQDMTQQWHTLGFVVRQGNKYVEVDRCDGTFITLLTPTLNFQDVPQGPMGMSRQTALAIVFEVKSNGGPVTLEFQSGPSHPRLQRVNTTVTVGPTSGSSIATARLWVKYETGADGEFIADQTVIHHVASGQTWTVTITANTVGRKRAAVALVLDRSGSMTEDRGDGQSKHKSLQEAAGIFVDVMLKDDAVSLVRYNHDAQQLQAATVLGAASDLFDPGRVGAKNLINGNQLNPSGNTSIGDGIKVGRAALNNVGSEYKFKSLVVLTDGKENSPDYIADVASDINERTYAIGLGTPQNTSAAALQTISGNHGGYLLMTGDITGDRRFILQKYFLQILAGISDADIVLDPTGQLVPGVEQRIPFQLTEADAGIEVILLTPNPQVVDFRLQPPVGPMIEPWRALAEPDMEFTLSDQVSFYRLVLPTELIAGRFDQAGTWHVVLSVGKPRVNRPRDGGNDDDARRRDSVGRESIRTVGNAAGIGLTTSPRRASSSAGPTTASNLAALYTQATTSGLTALLPGGRVTVPFNVQINSYSNLSFRASLRQSGYEPGSSVYLNAALAESGVPMSREASVWAEVVRPDGTQTSVQLEPDSREDGTYVCRVRTSIPGVYQLRIRATGQSAAGHPFHREKSLTSQVWHGGNHDANPATLSGGLTREQRDRDRKLCELLTCLLGNQVITLELEKRLLASGLDIGRLRECLKAFCRPPGGRESEQAVTAVQLIQQFVSQHNLSDVVSVKARDAQTGESGCSKEESVNACDRVAGGWRLRTHCRDCRRADALATTASFETAVAARAVIDASGRSSAVSVRLGARRDVVDRLVGVAVRYSSEHGQQPPVGKCHSLPAQSHSAGAFTLVEAIRDGWCYTAPLPGGGLIAIEMTDPDLFEDSCKDRLTAWQQRLAAAPHTRKRLYGLRMVQKPYMVSAMSHRLRRPHLDAPWLAAGDAALSVDPLSASGLKRALQTGHDSAVAIHAWLDGDRIVAEHYEAELDNEFTGFLESRAHYYAMESRWPESRFWSRRHQI